MEPAEYESMFDLEDTLWWYRGQREITKGLFKRFLPQTANLRVLDAGAGTGGSMEMLSQLGQVTVFDLSDAGTAHCEQRRPGRVVRASVSHMPFPAGHFDLVTIFDVTTTLLPAEDEMALSEVARVLKPGGRFFWREPRLTCFSTARTTGPYTASTAIIEGSLHPGSPMRGWSPLAQHTPTAFSFPSLC